MGIAERFGFKRLADSLTKTRENLVGKVSRMVTARGTIDEELLDQIEEVLIGADVGVDSSISIVETMKRHVRESKYVTAIELNQLLKNSLTTHFLNEANAHSAHVDSASSARPHVVMVVGVNGVGKTTTVGKLAHLYRKEGKSVLIAASDTFRAAAKEQLEVWSRESGASIVMQEDGSDPGAVAFDAYRSAVAGGTDILLVDTAGRLHTRVNLMEELKKIMRVLRKGDPTAPHEVLLVVDANTGQNGLEQARQFGRAVGVTGLVLTKLDGTAKGGIVLAIVGELQIPVKYVGLGEGIDDMEIFDANLFVDALFTPLNIDAEGV